MWCVFVLYEGDNSFYFKKTKKTGVVSFEQIYLFFVFLKTKQGSSVGRGWIRFWKKIEKKLKNQKQKKNSKKIKKIFGFFLSLSLSGCFHENAFLFRSWKTMKKPLICIPLPPKSFFPKFPSFYFFVSHVFGEIYFFLSKKVFLYFFLNY